MYRGVEFLILFFEVMVSLMCQAQFALFYEHIQLDMQCMLIEVIIETDYLGQIKHDIGISTDIWILANLDKLFHDLIAESFNERI